MLSCSLPLWKTQHEVTTRSGRTPGSFCGVRTTARRPLTGQGRCALRKLHGTRVAARGCNTRSREPRCSFTSAQSGGAAGPAESSHRRGAECGPSRVVSRRLQLHYFSAVAFSPKTQQQLCVALGRPAPRTPAQHRDRRPRDHLLQTAMGILSLHQPSPSPTRRGPCTPLRLLLGPTRVPGTAQGSGHCLTLGTDQRGRRACR